MKRMIKLLLIICVSIPLVVNARLNYDDSVQYANNYIYNFKEYQDYIHLKNNTPYDYVNNKSEVSSNFQSGGFISRKEYEISNIKGNSYLSNGLQYWTLTKSSYQKHYIVDYKLLEQFDTNLSGVRITEYVKPDVSVVGTGSYGNPWSFEELLSIHINSDNIQRGKVSSEECSNVSMRKESIHLSIAGSRSKAFYICPEEGYKFLKSTCSKYITNHSSNNMYTVDNLDRDNVICKVSYSYVTKGITVKGCSTCETAKTDKTIYVNNTHKIFLKDIDGTTKIEKIDNLPTKTGYTFKGYFTSETNHIEENKIIDNLGNLKYNEQLNTKNKVYPYMKANEYTIKYDCNGGTGTIESSHHIYDVEANLTSNNCKRKGYKFEGWSVSKTGSKTYNNSQGVKNLTSVDNETVTLFAVWTQCPEGTYGDNGTTCTKCPAGTYNGTSGSTSATACVDCPKGEYSAEGANSCTKCSKGYYASSIRNTKCTICPIGTYTSSTGSSSCTLCPAGTYNPNTGSITSTACKECPKGQYSAEGASSCTKCSKGYYASSTNSTKCTICPTGTYASSTGSASCTQCAAGTYNPNTGSEDSTACTKCSKGYYAEGTGNSSCTQCPAGTYAENTGAAKCTSCPAGYTSPVGSDSSSDCYVATSLPSFYYSGKFQVVQDDDTAISGVLTNTTFTGTNYTYQGNWKIRLLSDGDLTFYSYGKGTNIDIFLVGAGGKGSKGNIENGCYSANRFCCNGGSGGKGGACLTKKDISFSLDTKYTVDIGTSEADSKITISGNTYTAKGKSGAKGGGGIGGYSGDGGSGSDGCYEFDSSSYGTRYGGGGGGAAGSYSSDGRTGSGGSGGAGGGGRGGNSSYWSGYGSAGSNGKTNTGGGGGGGGTDQDEIYSAGSGGSGIVIIRNVR